MRYFDSRSHLRLLILSGLILLLGAAPLFALSLSLNGRNLAVFDDAALQAQAQNSTIPLESLYPWMQSVDYMEVQSGANRVFWENPDNWDEIRLVYHEGIWEVHSGRDIFSNPDRISINGAPLNTAAITIWSAVDIPDFKSDLLSALALRNLQIDWRDISRLEYRLSDTQPEALPNLVILDQFQLLNLDSYLTSSRPIAQMVSRWRGSGMPMAVDAYAPEAALLFLLSENPKLFDTKGMLPTGLANLFNRAAAARKNNLIVTNLPLTSLSAAVAASAVRLPSSTEPISSEEGILPIMAPPEGTVNIARLQFAAIPSALSSSDAIFADLVMKDARRITRSFIDEDAVQIPMDRRLLRFYDAYQRIGRLAISGQLESQEAVNLINQYIIDENNGK
ncbi:MAG: hypothetical protein DRZ90_16205 [Spirochaetes bacterium]|nr:MAG: hypothetical protein DRZ90_16205 [Spirochaetota bacterium]